MNIEKGCLARVINSAARNDGVVVTVLDYAGPPGLDGCDTDGTSGPRWFIDRQLTTNRGRKINHLGERQLQRIDEGNQPISWDEMAEIWSPETMAERQLTPTNRRGARCRSNARRSGRRTDFNC